MVVYDLIIHYICAFSICLAKIPLTVSIVIIKLILCKGDSQNPRDK